jgi:GAF domain-containing protein
VICVPIVANRSHLQGLLYVGGDYAFRPNDVILLSHLAQQASGSFRSISPHAFNDSVTVSIANALLFKSVQQQTKANLKMISSQRSALEDARRSREEALKATKVFEKSKITAYVSD